MAHSMQLMVFGAAVLVSVNQREDGKYEAKVEGRPEIQVTADTFAGAIAKTYNAVQHAVNVADAA